MWKWIKRLNAAPSGRLGLAACSWLALAVSCGDDDGGGAMAGTTGAGANGAMAGTMAAGTAGTMAAGTAGTMAGAMAAGTAGTMAGTMAAGTAGTMAAGTAGTMAAGTAGTMAGTMAAGTAGTMAGTMAAGTAGTVAGAMGAAGASAGTMAPVPGSPTFSAIYQEVIVAAGCNAGLVCHGGSAGMLRMSDKETAYAALVGVPAMGENLADTTNANCVDTGLVRVVPNQPDQSLIVQKVDPPGGVVPCGAQMPTTGVLTAEQVQQIRTWIMNGAQNN